MHVFCIFELLLLFLFLLLLLLLGLCRGVASVCIGYCLSIRSLFVYVVD